jgi:hypothetical protein
MRTIKYIFPLLALALVLFSCKDDNKTPKGAPTIGAVTIAQTVNYGDSVPFTVNVSDAERPLSTLLVEVYYNKDLAFSQRYRTKGNEVTVNQKLYMPYWANVPDGVANIRYMLTNVDGDTIEQKISVNVKHPDFSSLYLQLEDGTLYTLAKDANNAYTYKVNADLGSSFKGKILSKADGTGINWGWADAGIAVGGENSISFRHVGAGSYDISFNTLTFEALPNDKVTFAGTEMTKGSTDNLYVATINLAEAQPIAITGIPDMTGWFIDSDFFSNFDATTKSMKFNAETATYKVTADFGNKYFRVEKLVNGTTAVYPDGIWLIGSGTGKPDYNNNIGWNPDNALYCKKIADKKYQVTIKLQDGFSVKFFYQKGWGGEFGGGVYASFPTEYFNATPLANSGNIESVTPSIISSNNWYRFTIDASNGADKVALTVVQAK